jgi:hypothetical protein
VRQTFQCALDPSPVGTNQPLYTTLTKGELNKVQGQLGPFFEMIHQKESFRVPPWCITEEPSKKKTPKEEKAPDPSTFVLYFMALHE